MHAHRLNAYELAPAGLKALVAVETYLHQTTLGAQLIELAIRAPDGLTGYSCAGAAPSKVPSI